MLAKELTSRTLALGQRWLLTGELTRREAVTRPLIDRAFAHWRELGVLVGGESGPQRRTERFESREAIESLSVCFTARHHHPLRIDGLDEPRTDGCHGTATGRDHHGRSQPELSGLGLRGELGRFGGV